MRAHAIEATDRLPIGDELPELTDEQRQAIKAAERAIRAARFERERAQARERDATVKLGRALAAAPRRKGRGTPPAGTLTVDELAELAGLPNRQAVYDAINAAEAADAAEAPKPVLGPKRKGGAK
jgi:hypothetical protein